LTRIRVKGIGSLPIHMSNQFYYAVMNLEVDEKYSSLDYKGISVGDELVVYAGVTNKVFPKRVLKLGVQDIGVALDSWYPHDGLVIIESEFDLCDVPAPIPANRPSHILDDKSEWSDKCRCCGVELNGFSWMVHDSFCFWHRDKCYDCIMTYVDYDYDMGKGYQKNLVLWDTYNWCKIPDGVIMIVKQYNEMGHEE
jgi:hypothetical protein